MNWDDEDERNSMCDTSCGEPTAFQGPGAFVYWRVDPLRYIVEAWSGAAKYYGEFAHKAQAKAAAERFLQRNAQ